MRLKNIKGASEKILEGKYFISNPKNYRGKWNKLFNNNNPIYIEIGMGKGNFIIKNAISNPNINYIGIEMYDSVILRAVEKTNKLELMEGYIMIGFSIMMWFCSALLIFVSFSLLKGNYSSVHGKVFETTNDRKGYAKALGKPVLLIGICLLFSGVIAVILPKDYAISIAVIFILFIAVICSIWLYKIQKRFS